jgi:hypothetical protein
LAGTLFFSIQSSAIAAPTSFTPTGELTVTLRLGKPYKGELLRFARNRLTLRRVGARTLVLRHPGARSCSVRLHRGGRVKIVLSASRAAATLSVGRRSATIRGQFVTEDRVLVRSRRAVRRLKIVAGVPVGPASAPAPAAPPAPAAASAQLFARDSVWNAPLAPDAPLDPNSAALVQKLSDLVVQDQVANRGPWIATNEASTPLYVVPADQPVVPVQLHTGWWGNTLQDVLRAVPIPPNAKPARGGDAHLTIWQPSTDRLWELFQARNDPSTGWHAAYGGAIEHVSASLGFYDSNSWPGKSASYWGATATSLPVIGGTMLISELQAGVIPHALALAVPFARPKAFAFPAQRTDGSSTDSQAIPEGARFRLDPSLDVKALALPRITEMMALAAQNYGIIVRDQTGQGVSFYAEDWSQYGTDPYYGRGGLFSNQWPADLLKSFPWSRLQLLKMDLRAV